MPNPNPGESKKDYISRFMKSGEAQGDFPDDKQRLAVAYSMFEKKNSGPFGGTSEYPWPKQYKCSFIEPGVVFYQDLGPCKVCGNAFTCGNEGDACDIEGETVLVKQEALAKMAASFVGKPVIDMMHKDVTSSTVADGEADGIVTRVWLDDKSGWWMCEFLVWNPEAQLHCESPSYSVSCAYEPTEVDEAGGEYHNIPFAEEIKNGEYTHLALVTSPRYEGARIFVNSKGGKMDWKWFKKGERKNAASLDPLKTKVNVDGKEIPLQDLYDAAKEGGPILNDDTILEVDGKERTLADLKHAYRNKQKGNASGDPVEGAEKAEAGHAEHREKEAKNEAACAHCGAVKNEEKKPIVEPPLPDLKSSVDNPSQAEIAAKELDEKTKREVPLERAQSKEDEEKAAAEKAAAEKKNADEKAEKAEKEKELANAKREAGKKSFAALRNAREFGDGDAKISPVSIDDRLARGAKKYGSA